MANNDQAANNDAFAELPDPSGALVPQPYPGGFPPPPPPPGAYRAPSGYNSRAGSQAGNGFRSLPRGPGPRYIPHRRLLAHAVTNSKMKKLGGTHGDSAALNWFLSIAIVVGSITALVLSKNFLDAFARAADRDMEDYVTSYKATQVSEEA